MPTISISPTRTGVSRLPGRSPARSSSSAKTPATAGPHPAATEPERPVTLVHADRSGAAHALRHELPALQERLPNLSVRLWYEDTAGAELAGIKAEIAEGLVDPALVPLAPGAYVHLCGPVPFMTLVRGGLLRRGVPSARIAYEVFGPGMLR